MLDVDLVEPRNSLWTKSMDEKNGEFDSNVPTSLPNAKRASEDEKALVKFCPLVYYVKTIEGFIQARETLLQFCPGNRMTRSDLWMSFHIKFALLFCLS